jgi:hypothetical protein
MSTQPPNSGGCIENAKEPSKSATPTARIWGLAANGRTFAQSASLKNLTMNGTVITGLQQEIALNEVIGLQFKDVKTRVQVVWVDYRDAKNRSVEVRLGANQTCPWESELGNAKNSDSPSNRREFDRHLLKFPVDIKRSGSHAPMHLSANDISGSGCYLQTMSPSPAGTQLELKFWIESEPITCSGVVRTCDTGFGMGIEFVSLPGPVKQRLQAWLETHKAKATAQG